MKIKSISYKWLDLSTELINSWIILDDVIFNVSARTQINPNQLYHWWKATKTLSNLRLFTVYGKIVWVDSSARGKAMRVLNQYTWYIWVWEEYFELKFEDFNWWEYKCQAKIYATPNFESSVWSKWEPTIDFNFELLSNTAEYISYTNKLQTEVINQWPIWDDFDFWNDNQVWDDEIQNAMVSWWVELWVELWNELAEVRWINVINLWNFVARCKIQVIWNTENLKIINNTNWRFYWLTWKNTTNFVLDNTWKKFIAEDVWVDVSSFRDSWSVSILLNPWINIITLQSELDITGLEFRILYNDTYI